MKSCTMPNHESAPEPVSPPADHFEHAMQESDSSNHDNFRLIT
jgi:hypothetical protein